MRVARVTADRRELASSCPRAGRPALLAPGCECGDPGYLTETGQAADEDGSVAPVTGGLPAVEGSARDTGAPLDERGADLAEEPGRSSGPARPGHDSAPGSVCSRGRA